MTNAPDKPAKPLLGDAAHARAVEREARRAAALRANLQRRKAQSRARQDGDEIVPDPASRDRRGQ